jgi:hypothetical protein
MATPLSKREKTIIKEKFNNFKEIYGDMVSLEEDNIWIVKQIVNEQMFKIRLIFLKGYPFNNESLIIIIEEPFLYKFIIDKNNWNPLKSISNIFEDAVKPKIEEILTFRQTLPPIPNPAYLVLGSAPNENRRGRTHYDNPNIFLMDEIETEGPRYFKLSFTDNLKLGMLAALLPNSFDEICFDLSTVKAFKTSEETIIERLASLKNMLKPTGTLYIESPGIRPGGLHGEPGVNYKKPFLEKCREAGLISQRENIVSEIEGSVLIDSVFKAQGANGINILITKKIIEGGRTRIKTRKIRKYTSRSKRNYKKKE